jgi:hypothetical protein
MTANGLGLALAATEGEARRMDRLGGSSAFKKIRLCEGATTRLCPRALSRRTASALAIARAIEARPS